MEWKKDISSYDSGARMSTSFLSLLGDQVVGQSKLVFLRIRSTTSVQYGSCCRSEGRKPYRFVCTSTKCSTFVLYRSVGGRPL